MVLTKPQFPSSVFYNLDCLVLYFETMECGQKKMGNILDQPISAKRLGSKSNLFRICLEANTCYS